MGRTYTNATAMHKVPITVSFTCPKCNRAMTVEKFAVITGQAQMRGYENPQAGVAAQSNLVSTAENQIASIEKNLRRGVLGDLQEEGKALAFGKNIVCPNCGLKQILCTGGKQRKVWPKGFWLCLFGAYILAVILMAVIGINGGTGGKVSAVISMVAFAAVVGCIVYFSNRSNKAYNDPALMESKYKAMVNPVHVSSPEFSDPAGFLINSVL